MYSLKSSHPQGVGVDFHSMPWAFYFYRLETGRTHFTTQQHEIFDPKVNPACLVSLLTRKPKVKRISSPKSTNVPVITDY